MSKKIFKDYDAPHYEITFEEDNPGSGIRLVSLVSDPAIEIKGMFFSKEELKNYEFKTMPEKKMIVGPAMVPNKKIPRKDDEGDIYTVSFSIETIKLLVEKFNRDNTGKSINVEHTQTMAPGFINENWIIEDPYYDKSRLYGYNLPVGSWFITCKIEDDEFWETSVKENGLYSFSIEGLLGQKISNYSIEEEIDQLTDDEIINIFKNL